MKIKRVYTGGLGLLLVIIMMGLALRPTSAADQAALLSRNWSGPSFQIGTTRHSLRAPGGTFGRELKPVRRAETSAADEKQVEARRAGILWLIALGSIAAVGGLLVLIGWINSRGPVVEE